MYKKIYKTRTILFLLIFPAIAGNSIFAEEYPFADSNSVNIQKLDDEYFSTFRIDNDFNYGGEFTRVDSKTLSHRIIQFLRNIFDEVRGVFKVIPVLVKIVLWALALFFLVVLITKTKLNRLFYSNGGIKEPEFEIRDLTETLTDFDSAIQLETLHKQYRNAVRLLYLKIIHTLKKLDLIKYSKEKTNIDYLKELHNSKLKAGFSGLTGIYNNVWYGQFDITEMQYEQYESIFINFMNSINAEK